MNHTLRRAPALAALLIAQPALLRAEPPHAAPAVEKTAAQRKQEARERFQRGLTRSGRGAWTEALAEFLASRELYPTVAATLNAAIALETLQRDVEALAMYEALMRDFPALPPEERAEVERSVRELEARVGTLRLRGGEAGSAVWLDGDLRGTWPLPEPLRLAAGKHTLRVEKAGFVALERSLDLAGGEARDVLIHLTPERPSPDTPEPPPTPVAPPARRNVLDARLAPALAPTLGGDLSGGCSGSCAQTPSFGVRVGAAWEHGLSPSLGIGVGAGYLLAMQSISGRATELTPIGQLPDPGTADDALTLHAFLLGPSATLRLSERPLVRLGLGAGMLLGVLSDARTGDFRAPDGARYQPEEAASAHGLAGVYLDPDVRIAFRLSDRIELHAGIEALLLVPFSPPRYDDNRDIGARGAFATYPAEQLLGGAGFFIAPGVGARYHL